MSTKPTEPRTDRTGIGAVSLLAAALPGVLLVGGLALALQGSTARRASASAWDGFLAAEVASGAIAEAAHALRVEDLFDPALFGHAARPETFGEELLDAMVREDGLSPATRAFPGLSDADRIHAGIFRGDVEVRRMLVAVRFPRRWTRVRVPGVARRIAARNPGVVVRADDDLAVRVQPVVFRREYVDDVRVRVADPVSGVMRDAPGPGAQWVAWGVARFAVRVRTEDLRGPRTHAYEAERRFALRTAVGPGEDVLKVSSANLRFALAEVEP